jgi:hypothetical protein
MDAGVAAPVSQPSSINKTDEMPLGENGEFPFYKSTPFAEEKRESVLTFKNSSKRAQILN